MAFTNFPSQLVPLIQTGFLARFLEEGLDSELAYRRNAITEKVPGRLGQTITMTRNGRKPPVTQFSNPQNFTSLDNGMVPSTCAVEQYSYTLGQLDDTVDVDLMGEIAGIADQLRMNSRNSGVQASQSLERVAKSRLFAAYATGNTFVTTFSGTYPSTSTSCHVDDIRGFQNVMVSGVIMQVSVTNPLIVNELPGGSGGLTQTLTVTAAVPDAINVSAFPSDNPGVQGSAGISGTLTFASGPSDPVNGDGLKAINAPTVVRSGGAIATPQLNAGNTFNYSMVQDAEAVLRNNAVPNFPDGTHHLIFDNTSQRQLFADQAFIIASASLLHSPEFQNGAVFKLFGVTFITTTEAYIQLPNASAGVNVTVHRPILMGAECLLQGNFEGLELWLNRQSIEAIGNVFLVDGIAQIVRPPLDRQQRMASISWVWIGDFAVPTDMTATSSTIPTASNAMFKRCVAMEHAG